LILDVNIQGRPDEIPPEFWIIEMLFMKEG
jgi:hypothetical protein